MTTIFCPHCTTFLFIHTDVEKVMLQCHFCYKLLDGGEQPDCPENALQFDWQVSYKPHRYVRTESPFVFRSCCERHAVREAMKRLYGHLSAVQMGVQGTSPVQALMGVNPVRFITARFPQPTSSTISGQDGHYFKLEQL